MLAGIDTLWHCSSFTSPWGTQQAFDLANVRATRRLGEWSVAWGVRNFVHISSPSLYFDYHHHRDIQEDFRPHRFANEFARSKAASEEVINLLAQANPAYPFYHSAAAEACLGRTTKSLSPAGAQMMQHYGSVLLPRAAAALVDMTYYENAVHAMWLASQPACDHLPSARAWKYQQRRTAHFAEHRAEIDRRARYQMPDPLSSLSDAGYYRPQHGALWR